MMTRSIISFNILAFVCHGHNCLYSVSANTQHFNTSKDEISWIIDSQQNPFSLRTSNLLLIQYQINKKYICSFVKYRIRTI